MVYIKCQRCGIIFNHNNIKKRYCHKCTIILNKESVRKSVNKKYNNDKKYREKKKEQARNKFIHDNFYGLILGTTKIGSHRRKNFSKESNIVKREKNRVLNGRTYTNPKFQDLVDEKHEKIHKTGIKKKEYPSAIIPKDINNFEYVNEMCHHIINHFCLEIEDYDKEIIGCKKVELKYYNRYIMFRRLHNRNVECIVEILKREDDLEKQNLYKQTLS